MSDNRINITDNPARNTVDTPVGTKLQELLSFTSTGTVDESAGTFTSITGMTAQNITIPVAGNYVVCCWIDLRNAGGSDCLVELGIKIGGVDTLLGETNLATTNSEFKRVVHFNVVALSAGSISFEPIFRAKSGASTVRHTSGELAQIVVF